MNQAVYNKTINLLKADSGHPAARGDHFLYDRQYGTPDS